MTELYRSQVQVDEVPVFELAAIRVGGRDEQGREKAENERP